MKHHPLLLTIWKDKKIVPIVSNIHLSKFVKIEKKYENSKITKTMPKSIDDYNTYARGVDRCNQISHHYRFPHKSRKWWRQIFMHILHMIVANSRVIHTKEFPFSARSGPNRELLPKVPDQISYTLENLSGIKNLLLI